MRLPRPSDESCADERILREVAEPRLGITRVIRDAIPYEHTGRPELVAARQVCGQRIQPSRQSGQDRAGGSPPARTDPDDRFPLVPFPQFLGAAPQPAIRSGALLRQAGGGVYRAIFLPT